MTPGKWLIPPKGAILIDGISALNIENAECVAFRKLRADEYEVARTAPAEVSAQSTKAILRLEFVDRLRYSHDLDMTDIFEEKDRNSLEVYLLCTCLDTLAGKEDYYDLQTWLRASNKLKNNHIQGLNKKHQFLQELEGTEFSPSIFQESIKELLNIYNDSYGVNRNLLELVKSLPEALKKRLASMYIIHKKGEDPAVWERKTTDEKLKLILLDYIFTIRRNKYTHTGETFEHFGGITALRNALSRGSNYEPPSSKLEFQLNQSVFVVTCVCGDEALFLREMILACIAKFHSVLDESWLKRYKKAETLRRRLLALQYELSYNLNVLQGHLGVLGEGFLLRNSEGYLFLESKFANNIHRRKRGFALPFKIPILSYYLESLAQFNKNVQQAQDNVYLAVQETGVIRWLQKLREICENLLKSYPKWTYMKNTSFTYDIV